MKWINKFTDSGMEYQEDEVGNKLQINGAIEPIKCQKCKHEFNSSIKQEPLTQQIMFYKCDNCDFENTSGESMLFHLQENKTHAYSTKEKERIVKIEKKITGIIPIINKIKNDIFILCGDCNESQKK